MKQLQNFSLLIVIVLLSTSLFGQKKVIDYQAFDGWKTLKNEQVSPSGKYVTYEIQPHKGDTYLYWYNTETGKLDSVLRAKNANFSEKESFLIYTIEAGYDTLRKVELDKIDKKKWPKDSLAVYSFSSGKVEKIANVKTHQVGEKHNWLSYTENENEIKGKAKPVDPKKKSKDDFFDWDETDKKKKPEEPKKEKTPKSEGKVLRLWNLEDGNKIAFKNVTSYSISEKGEVLVYVEHLNDTCTVHFLDLKSFKHQEIEKKFTGVETLTFDKHAKRMVFLGAQDTTKTKLFELFLYDVETNRLSCLIDTTSENIPKEWTVVKNIQPRFSEINDRLYFGVFDVPKADPKDTLIENEKPKFDLWHYNEPILQTQQISTVKKDMNKSYWYVYDFDSGKITGLENDTLSIQSNFYELNNALARNSRPYDLEYMWDVSGKQDYYHINLKTGERKLIKKGVTNAVELSRKGDEFVYFNHENGQYYSIHLSDQKEICLTCNAKGKTWSGDNNGMPMEETPIGFHGWNKAGTQIFLSEKNDFYMYDFSKNELVSLTQDLGVKNNIEFTPRLWNRDSSFVELNDFYLTGLDKKTKGSHLYFFENGKPVKKAYWDAKITSIKKAKNADVLAIRTQTVKDYPEIQLFLNNDFSQSQQISVTNPQQSEYNWATAELISWKTYKGLELEGLVYKPENFDTNKNYPLLVYYYELYSDDLHNHYAPRPTASIIFPTEYASADYIVFIPDIRYEPGHPAKSAYDCIMSGTDAVLKKYPNIDSTRMGLQGQSWGGYQTAQLVTMTTRYKAAMAGAPVGNMFSAFGGIRWSTGMSRQFQYEKTQSRIGKTIWEAPELYVENSPVFHLPKVQTPLLIMHNDDDGAVPWYQGIEIFTGMRRLGKPCWLLNYNEDGHNLMKTANRRDLSIRMRQFFDHYLQNKPAPRWLTEGIPAVKKGKELRYELD